MIERLGRIWRRLGGGSSGQQAAAEPMRHDPEADGATVEPATLEPKTHRPTAEEAPSEPAEDAASEAPEVGRWTI